MRMFENLNAPSRMMFEEVNSAFSAEPKVIETAVAGDARIREGNASPVYRLYRSNMSNALAVDQCTCATGCLKFSYPML